MADPPKEFPDVSSKLSAPKKLSAFEKERQAADEKRRRAEAEDAAALKAFQDSFADEDDDPLAAAIRARDRVGAPPAGPRGGRGYGGAVPPMGGRGRGGYGGGGGGGGDMGPPSLKRKRALDEMREAQEARREREQAMHGYEESRHAARAAEMDEEREDEAPRPTVQLSRLPLDITSEGIRALLKPYLQVHSVQLAPPSVPGPGTVGKRLVTAIASLTTETSTGQIDTAVSALKDKYLGCGFYLSISRHLSSVALHPSMTAMTTSTSSEPFGAEKPREPPRGSLRNAPPPDQRGFGPPGSYDYPPRGDYGAPPRPEAVVSVQAPLDVTTIRAIHTLVERLTTEPDPKRALQIEALLMATPSVQNDERFAFLYDSRSPAGVYYRYLLWGPPPSDPSDRKRRAKGLERVYDDVVIDWSPPDWQTQVPFLDLTSLADVVTDMDYVSSDEESDDEGGERRFYNGKGQEGPVEANKKEHLNPVKRARLVHLLSRLPTSNARLRKGDIARVTNFAINHAGQGAEEIVDLLLLNIEKPFSYSLAAKYEASDDDQDEEDEYEPDDNLPSIGTGSPAPQKDGKREQDDPSNAKLIGLYCISDILSASSTAGARNAWKYRQLFESGFKAQHTFEKLGKLDKELGWGRLKAEQWKRRVSSIFAIWEGWSVFSSDVHEELKMAFLEPPMSEEEKRAEAEKLEVEEKRKAEEKRRALFKRVGDVAGSASPARPAKKEDEADDVDGQPMDEDVDGAPLAMDEDVDGAPMLDEDVDGAPMAMDEDVDGAPMVEAPGVSSERTEAVASTPVNKSNANGNGAGGPPGSTPLVASSATPKPVGPKRRMRAEDMFASDEE